MPTPSVLEAARVSPPGPADGGAGQPNRPFVTAFTTASAPAPCTTITAGDLAAIPQFGCYITWVTTADCYIRIGTSGMNVASTSDWLLIAGVPQTWWHDPTMQSHFSVLQRVGGGNLLRYRSNTVP